MTTELDVTVAGYASVDFVFRGLGPVVAGRTTLLTDPIEPKPNWGGCGPNAAVELTRMGDRAGLITWLGSDSPGQQYFQYLERTGVDCSAIVLGRGPSPRSYLFYDPAGIATCFYHPSGSPSQGFNRAAADLVTQSAWAAFTVCPPALTQALLEAARAGGKRIAWNVKADADAYPPALRRALAKDAALICLNAEEVAFVGEATGVRSVDDLAAYGRAIVVLTKGADGCETVWSGGRVSARSEPVAVPDPTGAGDVFFAAFLHGLVRNGEPDQVAREAVAYAAEFLRRRLSEARL